MGEKILYAKSGGPPDDWQGLKVFDIETGIEITQVQEVSVTEPWGTGWVIRAANDAEGKIYLAEDGESIAVERLNGRYRIERPNDE